MKMYLVINVENMKYYDPPMIMDKVEDAQVSAIDDFVPKY